MKKPFRSSERPWSRFKNLTGFMAALLTLVLPEIAQAQFRYTTNNGAIIITQFTGSGEFVAIPSSTNGYTITGLASKAFYSSSLTNVIIPASITNIGNAAFSFCSSLTSFEVDGANPDYSSPNGVLFDKLQTTLVEFPVAIFGSYSISNNVTKIGDYAFYGSSLGSVTIPQSVTNIGNHAFNSCYILSSVAIPSSVISIGTDAFSACTSMTGISVDAANPAYSSTNGVLFDKPLSTLIQAPAGLDGSIDIPSGVVTIGIDAFYQCFNLLSVAFPESLTSVGDHAFYQCTSLTNVALPDGVTNIATYAFASCSGITNLTLPKSLTTIGSYAFNSCYNLPTVSIAQSLMNLGSQAFSSCTALKSAYFYGNAPADGSGAFSGDPAIVYYLAGTTGWGSKFGGVPAVLWNPQPGVQAKSPGLTNGEFGFGLSGSASAVVVVQACTDLANPIWIPVGTNTLTGGASTFSDPQTQSYPRRFYRLKLP